MTFAMMLTDRGDGSILPVDNGLGRINPIPLFSGVYLTQGTRGLRGMGYRVQFGLIGKAWGAV